MENEKKKTTIKECMKAAFPKTIPVLTGYMFLGIAFGILLSETGHGVLYSLLMSVFIFAGSAQILCVSLLANHASLPQVALLIFLLNFRHFFYGLSMISKYRGSGKKKWYLIFALTDETFALLCARDSAPKGLDEHTYYTVLSAMNQSYWVMGSVIGGALGSLVNIPLNGIDFVMTSLFAVLVVEQWKSNKNKIPALIGFAVTIACLIFIGPDNFLIPALIIISGVLLGLQKPMGVLNSKLEEQSDKK